jgi:5-hydroxyisourate hydrolase
MENQVVSRPARRQFALSGLALGAVALAPRAALAQAPAQPAAAPASPAQASGPIVLHGVSPRLTVHAPDTSTARPQPACASIFPGSKAASTSWCARW